MYLKTGTKNLKSPASSCYIIFTILLHLTLLKPVFNMYLILFSNLEVALILFKNNKEYTFV